jgi:hypothetical protein
MYNAIHIQDGKRLVTPNRHQNDPKLWGQLEDFSEIGGHVAGTATVHPEAYVGPDVQVTDFAVVEAGVKLFDRVHVSGHGRIGQGSTLMDDVRVSGQAYVCGWYAGCSHYGGTARVLDHDPGEHEELDREYAYYVIKGHVYDKNWCLVAEASGTNVYYLHD